MFPLDQITRNSIPEVLRLMAMQKGHEDIAPTLHHIANLLTAHVRVDEHIIFQDIPAARVQGDGSIVRTVNGAVMPPGTELFMHNLPLER